MWPRVWVTTGRERESSARITNGMTKKKCCKGILLPHTAPLSFSEISFFCPCFRTYYLLWRNYGRLLLAITFLVFLHPCYDRGSTLFWNGFWGVALLNPKSSEAGIICLHGFRCMPRRHDETFHPISVLFLAESVFGRSEVLSSQIEDPQKKRGAPLL